MYATAQIMACTSVNLLASYRNFFMKTIHMISIAALAVVLISGCASRVSGQMGSQSYATYGVVQSINMSNARSSGINAGTVIGGVVGAVAGNQVGSGRGRGRRCCHWYLHRKPKMPHRCTTSRYGWITAITRPSPKKAVSPTCVWVIVYVFKMVMLIELRRWPRAYSHAHDDRAGFVCHAEFSSSSPPACTAP